MIYFDNAATTAVKPPEVAEAVARAVNSFGGAGRGVHEASLDAGYAVFRARQQLARLLGGGGDAGRCGIVALDVGDADSAAVGDALNAEFGICTRAGAHCAPLMHEALGTQRQGAVRFSFSSFNTEDEVDAGIAAVAAIAEEA